MLALTSRTAVKLFALSLPLLISFHAGATSVCSNLFASKSHAAIQDILETSQQSLSNLGYRPVEGSGSKEIWTFDGPKGNQYSPKRSYEEAFTALLAKLGVRVPYDFFENVLRYARIQNQRTDVLDIFGSGFILENPVLADSITGIRFGPLDPKKLPTDYPVELPTEILGDALNLKTWQQLDESMAKRAIPSFKLVTMRPEGGWQQAPFGKTEQLTAHALKFLIGQVLLRLNPEGRFYFKVPTELHPAHPALSELGSIIAAETSYRLVLLPTVSMQRTYYLEGAIVPKSSLR